VADTDGGINGFRPGEPDLAWLEPVLDGAALLGVELEPRFRVLAVTVEPEPERYVWEERDDRRLQVLCHPVSTILASLRRESDGQRQLLAFEEDQLVDVVAALGGPALSAPLFGLPEPRPGEWGPRFSLEGRSTAPDGTGRTLTLSVATDDARFDLFARFDVIDLKDADGDPLAL
jgi:hypothetical protein